MRISCYHTFTMLSSLRHERSFKIIIKAGQTFAYTLLGFGASLPEVQLLELELGVAFHHILPTVGRWNFFLIQLAT